MIFSLFIVYNITIFFLLLKINIFTLYINSNLEEFLISKVSKQVCSIGLKHIIIGLKHIIVGLNHIIIGLKNAHSNIILMSIVLRTICIIFKTYSWTGK